MARKGPPPGYMTAGEANNILGGMLYKHVHAGRLQSYKPGTRRYGFYRRQDIMRLATLDKAFFEEGQVDPGAIFMIATPEDMDGVYELATHLFGQTISAERRREWVRKEPRGHYVVKRKDMTIVAYFYLQPLKHDRMIAYMNQEIRGWDITADDLDPFEPGKPVEAMLGGIGSLPNAKNAKDEDIRSNYVAVLLRGVLRDVERLGREGITISKLYGYSDNREGIALCAYLGMQQYAPPRGKRCTFILDVRQSPSPYLQRYKKALAEWEQQHSG
jgi:hypothetical protein